MGNVILLVTCFVIGILLRRSRRLPENAHAAWNGFVIHVSLPSLTLVYVHDLKLSKELLFPAAMAWMLFALGCAFFWCIGRLLKLAPRTVGALTLVGGMAADAYDRRRVMQLAQLPYLASAGLLSWATWQGAITLPFLYAAVFANAVSFAFDSPARQAFLPSLVSLEAFPRAVTFASTATSLHLTGWPAATGFSTFQPCARPSGRQACASESCAGMSLPTTVSATSSPTSSPLSSSASSGSTRSPGSLTPLFASTRKRRAMPGCWTRPRPTIAPTMAGRSPRPLRDERCCLHPRSIVATRSTGGSSLCLPTPVPAAV